MNSTSRNDTRPARAALLARCLEYLEQGGFSDMSLRGLAAGVGTTHRMLIYHFGSREGLLAQVVATVEERQRARLLALGQHAGDLAELSKVFWRELADPKLRANERLFFEIYAHAISGREWAAPFRESVVSAWAEPIEALLRQHGVPPDQAATRARLALAVSRGLLMDLLATGDVEATTAAADLYADLAGAEPRTTRGA